MDVFFRFSDEPFRTQNSVDLKLPTECMLIKGIRRETLKSKGSIPERLTNTHEEYYCRQLLCSHEFGAELDPDATPKQLDLNSRDNG